MARSTYGETLQQPGFQPFLWMQFLGAFNDNFFKMVPHGGVEERITALISEAASCVVTAVPDASRGERLVAFYTDACIPPARLWEALCRTELPKLWLPKREDLHRVRSIPVLGTGKVDLRAVRQLALDSL